MFSSGLQPLQPSKLASIAEQEEVFFLYLHPEKTPETEVAIVQAATRSLVGAAPVYESTSSELFSRFRYPAAHPYLIAFKDHDAHPALSFNFSTPRSTSTTADVGAERMQTETEVTRWLHANKMPTLGQLNSGNYGAYMEEGQLRAPSFIVLAAVSKDRLGQDGTDEQVYALEKIAKTWLHGLRFTPRQKGVHFVWVDSDKWSRFLSSTYGFKPFDKEPTVLVIDPSNDQYFPRDGQGHLLRIDGSQIFGALESLYGGTTAPKLKPVTTVSFGDRIGRWLGSHLGFIVYAAGNHPFMASFLCILAFMAMFCLLVYYMDGAEEAGYSAVQTNGGEMRGKSGSPPVHQPKYVETKHSLYGGVSSRPTVKKD